MLCKFDDILYPCIEFDYIFDFISLISFSNFIAKPIFPLIFNCPDIKAAVGFNFPVNISTNFSVSQVIVTSASPPGGSPLPQEPLPFFKSKNHEPVDDPLIDS